MYLCSLSSLNDLLYRSHHTASADHKYALLGANGFCAVAGEDELNRGGDLGTEANIFYLLENDWEQGDDLAF